MSGMIETEMTDCLEQMAKLQEKMERLQEEKNKQAAEDVVKQNSTEPNLQVMSDWLDKYGEIIEEIERERVIEEQYRELEHHRDNGLENKIIKYKKIINFDKDLDLPIKRFRHEIGREIGHDIHSKEEIEQLRIKYEPTPEEYELYKNKDIIIKKYLDLCEKKKLNRKYYGTCERARVNGRKEVISRKDILFKVPIFMSTNNNPSYFMKQYIEATHNMFLIQQKRIDELERKIQEF
jgi:hypothetical protein